jgi:hypothetical protein
VQIGCIVEFFLCEKLERTMATLIKRNWISNGDYVIHGSARTFTQEFYYVNFIDKLGKFDSKYSRKFRKQHQANAFVRDLMRARNGNSSVPYAVAKIGIYSSHEGHIQSFRL